MRAALYARVSTGGQEPENQLRELRHYAETRGWTAAEYVDRESGTRDHRPSLDAMLRDARRRRFDVILCWRLDRLGRNLRHLVTVLDDLAAIGVGFVTLNEALDTTTPGGRLQMHVLAALAQFEAERIKERVRAGLARARAQGVVLGRPKRQPPLERIEALRRLPAREAARQAGVSRSTWHRWIAKTRNTSSESEIGV